MPGDGSQISKSGETRGGHNNVQGRVSSRGRSQGLNKSWKQQDNETAIDSCQDLNTPPRSLWRRPHTAITSPKLKTEPIDLITSGDGTPADLYTCSPRYMTTGTSQLGPFPSINQTRRSNTAATDCGYPRRIETPATPPDSSQEEDPFRGSLVKPKAEETFGACYSISLQNENRSIMKGVGIETPPLTGHVHVNDENRTWKSEPSVIKRRPSKTSDKPGKGKKAKLLRPKPPFKRPSTVSSFGEWADIPSPKSQLLQAQLTIKRAKAMAASVSQLGNIWSSPLSKDEVHAVVNPSFPSSPLTLKPSSHCGRNEEQALPNGIVKNTPSTLKSSQYDSTVGNQSSPIIICDDDEDDNDNEDENDYSEDDSDQDSDDDFRPANFEEPSAYDSDSAPDTAASRRPVHTRQSLSLPSLSSLTPSSQPPPAPTVPCTPTACTVSHARYFDTHDHPTGRHPRDGFIRYNAFKRARSTRDELAARTYTKASLQFRLDLKHFANCAYHAAHAPGLVAAAWTLLENQGFSFKSNAPGRRARREENRMLGVLENCGVAEGAAEGPEGDGSAEFHRGVVETRRVVLKTHRNRAANDEKRLKKELERAEMLYEAAKYKENGGGSEQ